MLYLNTLHEFSRAYCVGICSFLVPANLLTAILVMRLVALRRSSQVWQAVGIGSLFASAMVFHVLSWFAIGIVMAPTYILLLLGTVCLSINAWAIAHPSSMRQLLLLGADWVSAKLLPRVPKWQR